MPLPRFNRIKQLDDESYGLLQKRNKASEVWSLIMKYLFSIIFLIVFSFAAYGQASCNYQLPRSIPTFPASGGSYTFNYTIGDPRCKVEFDRNNTFDWITANVSATTITITVTQNAQRARAQAAAFRVTQDPVFGGTQSYIISVSQESGCAITITPPSQLFNADGGPGGFAVNGLFQPTRSDNGCRINNTTINAAWVTNFQTSPFGNCTGFNCIPYSASYNIAANTGAARVATITFDTDSGILIFTINQAAGTTACAYALGTLSQTFISAGDTGFVDVQTQAGCSFSSLSNNDFITITSGDGTGSGTVTFSVAANSGAARTGTLFIAGQTFTVNQSGAVKSRKRVRFF